MDFKQYFNQTSAETSATNINSLEEVRNILESLAENVNDSEKSSIESFTEKYGDPQEFVLRGFDDMMEPYAEVMRDSLLEMIQNSPEKEHMPVLCGASLDVARNLAKLHLKNSFGVGVSQYAEEVARKVVQLDRQFTTDSMKEQMLIISAMLQYLQMCFGELTVNSIISKMEKDNQ